jgi:hypothetical protein
VGSCHQDSFAAFDSYKKEADLMHRGAHMTRGISGCVFTGHYIYYRGWVVRLSLSVIAFWYHMNDW